MSKEHNNGRKIVFIDSIPQQVQSIMGFPANGYKQLISEGLGVMPTRIEHVDVNSFKSAANLPDIKKVDAIVAGGSLGKIKDNPPLQEKVEGWLASAIDRKKIPTLGICYGEQTIADALGGEINESPKGRRIGTAELTVTNEGKSHPLLRKVADNFTLFAANADYVEVLPKGATVLAEDKNFQQPDVIKFRPNAYGIQAHPEITANVMTMSIKFQENTLRKEQIKPKTVYEQIKQTKSQRTENGQLTSGQQILRNFATIFKL